jgi:hypothetical protein
LEASTFATQNLNHLQKNPDFFKTGVTGKGSAKPEGEYKWGNGGEV